jgi:hypothetical protein
LHDNFALKNREGLPPLQTITPKKRKQKVDIEHIELNFSNGLDTNASGKPKDISKNLRDFLEVLGGVQVAAQDLFPWIWRPELLSVDAESDVI